MTPAEIAGVLARVRAAVDEASTVELYGSSVYAPAHADDVDVLVSNAEAARLATALELAAIPTTPPRLHGVLDGVSVDVTVVTGDDDVARRMRSGPRDAAALVEHLRAAGRDEAFQRAWPFVRRFVHARALGRNGLGWFGSFGWALLLAAPLATDLRDVPDGAVIPAWLRWLARLPPNARIALDGVRSGPESVFLVAPTPPTRDVAHLSKRAATVWFAELRAAATAIGDAATDDEALDRIVDLAAAPPPGTTLAIQLDDEATRGRYEGVARGLLQDLEALGAVRSWGRFEATADGWEHRITVPAARAKAAGEAIDRWLALVQLDATLRDY